MDMSTNPSIISNVEEVVKDKLPELIINNPKEKKRSRSIIFLNIK
ncbi:MAG: hypothetical protein RR359_04145 [Bacilli bacterium]